MWIKKVVFLVCCHLFLFDGAVTDPLKKRSNHHPYAVDGDLHPYYRLRNKYTARIGIGGTPPYAVAMEPLVQYSQRDPLYETNFLPSPSSSSSSDEDFHYAPKYHHHRIIERPVYIKEPEPIIEIIIKESNVTLPEAQLPIFVPPKKKEQVQVFYVKYKKNPNGTGKDSIIYDPPIPAISPPIKDEDVASPQDIHHPQIPTPPPQPKQTTTLRTVIHPDSEIYHSHGSGIKVTFGKEGFDFEKRSSKPQARQLDTFPPFNYAEHHPPPPIFRQPQPYRPFPVQYNRPPPPDQFPKPPPPPPPPPVFRQPVPYQPFFPTVSPAPPGGELIESLPKFEQHIQYETTNNKHLSPDEYNRQIQQQFQRRPQFPIQQQYNRPPPPPPPIQQFHQQRPPQFNQNRPIAAVLPTPNTTPRIITTTTPSTTTSTTTVQSTISTTTQDPVVLNARLPEEVPDELREQLLASGILNNADISILDYDKVGDIPLSALPPDQLANFYSAGGGQQLAAAASILQPTTILSSSVNRRTTTSNHIVDHNQPVQMKIVHYDPEGGKSIPAIYVQNDAKRTEPVILNDATYNRYLPLKLSGAQFPIPNLAEFENKHISSVVVLAPISYDFNQRAIRATGQRKGLIQAPHLLALIQNPSLDNYRNFLDIENHTRIDQQSVILLVTDGSSVEEREIYMYDVGSQMVNRLNGTLSAAFVDAANANSDVPSSRDYDENQTMQIVENHVPISVETKDFNDEEEAVVATEGDWGQRVLKST